MWDTRLFLLSIFLLHYLVHSSQSGICEYESYCETQPGVLEYCPYENGVCCNDGQHCCPHGSVCDVEGQRCTVVNGEQFSLRNLVKCPPKSDANHSPLFRVLDAVNDGAPVLCPDRKAACPMDTTCCQMGPDNWGCCEHKNAVCCADQLHCCPQGYRCDAANSSCVPSERMSSLVDKFVSLLSRLPALYPTLDDNSQLAIRTEVCPDGRHRCPAETSCCRSLYDSYACCPMPDAVCCSDGAHCCPSGTVCDIDAGQCLDAFTKVLRTTPVERKTSLISNGTSGDQMCPDKQSLCPDGETCCLSKDGGWGCCPVPEAVCCSDGLHCCPKGFRCDITLGICTRQSEASSSNRVNDDAPVVCPDPDWQCENGTTCCPLANEEWGCCNLPNAVCCSDGAHCCPDNYRCDVANNQCIKSDSLAVSFTGIESTMKQLRCTSPGYHCPEYTRCDAVSGECIPDTRGQMMWFRKFPARLKDNRPFPIDSGINCPSSKWRCHANSTCCQQPDGLWACCPLPSAVCCPDQLHCCPHGSECSETSGLCVLTDQFKKVLTTHTTAGPTVVEPSSIHSPVLCPGGQMECPENSTCCKMSDSSWGCCPSENAVCCPDGIHCCPKGYTCSAEDSTCIRLSQQESIKQPVQSPAPMNNLCPDRRSYCIDRQTCCQLIDGDFGCCPLVNGTCCADRLHCCPEGTTCADEEGECVRQSRVVSQNSRISAFRMSPVPDSGSGPMPARFYRIRVPNYVIRTGWCAECANNGYCCPDALGLNNRMCCEKAGSMCCSDGLHCCPPGTKCAKHGQCDRITEDRFLAPFLIASKRLGGAPTVDRSIPAKKSRPALVDPRLKLSYFRAYKSVRWTICPDHKRACHLDEQCCPSVEHTYVCAAKSAICCSDTADSNCPEGSRCNPNGTYCRLTEHA